MTDAVAPSNGVTTTPIRFEPVESIFCAMNVFFAFTPVVCVNDGDTVGSTPLPPPLTEAFTNPTLNRSPPEVVNPVGVILYSAAELLPATDQEPPVTELLSGSRQISYLILLNLYSIPRSPGNIVVLLG